ncbi:hypothetical protein [Bacillus amyloliquefaciens]|uniref:hypothetical protein n=1 Tax=Bacillus amyloliquefaciens TaxID=1390 RepID=UPI000B43CE08|nr:hypothetical protein [Bacillus amyloliquefaciens]ARW40237.1 hypothetical protein S101267_03177 [Bacillus amyloliquefaciens]
MNIKVNQMERMRDLIFFEDKGGLPQRHRIGTKVEATIDFESGNRAQAIFEFPDASDLSFEEAERLIRKELGAE